MTQQQWQETTYSDLRTGDRFTLKDSMEWNFYKDSDGYFSGRSGMSHKDLKPDTVVLVPKSPV
jgi:hypothetical protein